MGEAAGRILGGAQKLCGRLIDNIARLRHGSIQSVLFDRPVTLALLEARVCVCRLFKLGGCRVQVLYNNLVKRAAGLKQRIPHITISAIARKRFGDQIKIRTHTVNAIGVTIFKALANQGLKIPDDLVGRHCVELWLQVEGAIEMLAKIWRMPGFRLPAAR